MIKKYIIFIIIFIFLSILCIGDNFVNGNGDTVFDNCPEEVNLNQADADGDGIGDACDNDTIYGYISGAFFDGLNVDIAVFDCGSDLIIDTVITDEDGYYSMGDLEENWYFVYPNDEWYVFIPQYIIVKIGYPMWEKEDY